MVKSEEEVNFETNLWHLFLFKMLRRMTNPALKGLRISGTKILFEFENLVFRLSDDFSSLISKLGFTSHVFSSVVEMAAAFLKSPVLKARITEELLFKLVKSLFREGSHRHFFAFLQQLMLQNNSKYQLRTDDGKTWSLFEQNKSGDFTMLHTLPDMDTKKVVPPLDSEENRKDDPPKYSHGMSLRLLSQQDFLQKLKTGQTRLHCQELDFHVDSEEYERLLGKVIQDLQEFSHENFVSRLIPPPMPMKKFLKNPDQKKTVQLKASELTIKPDVIQNPCPRFDRLSKADQLTKLEGKKKSFESSQDKSSDFEDIVTCMQKKANELSTKQFEMVCERISKPEFDTRMNQSTQQTFDTLVEDIEQLGRDVDSLPEVQEQKLLIFNEVRQILDTRPDYANINMATQKRMIDDALQALGQ